MFVISNKQIDVFKGQALQKFEDEMVEHVKEFFPKQFIMAQENGIRETIIYGHNRAKKYGWDTKRNVCLYINNMMMLGSNFDLDPQYPWVQSMIKDKEPKNPSYRIDLLSDKVMYTVDQFSGRKDVYLNRALFNIIDNGPIILQEPMDYEVKEPLKYLKKLFPEKYEVVGDFDLLQMCKLGINNALKHGITQKHNLLIYYACMFFMGSWFNHDPQYSWVNKILNDIYLEDEYKKMEMVYKTTLNKLQDVLLK